MTYTKQQIFDQVARAIIAQGKPSVDDTHCLYRAPDGSKCAAGHLIPDDEYSPDMENIQASYVGGRDPAAGGPISVTLQQIVDDVGAKFVDRLQTAHDAAAQSHSDFLGEYGLAMRDVARREGLSTEVLDA